MERLPRLRARIASLHELRDLMRALRALAAAHVQEAHGALAGMRRYTDVIEDSIADALGLLEAKQDGGEMSRAIGRGIVIAVCSEHGFVGALNEQVLDRAAAEIDDGRQLVIVGRRGAVLAEERKLRVMRRFPMPTHVGGVLALTRRTADYLATAASTEIVYPAYRRGARFFIAKKRVLPLDPELFRGKRSTERPLHQLPLLLLQRLGSEYLFTELTAAVMESLASENGARLAVMEAADHNIGERLDALTRQEHSLRQNTIIEELLDVVTGAEAVMQDGRWRVSEPPHPALRATFSPGGEGSKSPSPLRQGYRI